MIIAGRRTANILFSRHSFHGVFEPINLQVNGWHGRGEKAGRIRYLHKVKVGETDKTGAHARQPLPSSVLLPYSRNGVWNFKGSKCLLYMLDAIHRSRSTLALSRNYPRPSHVKCKKETRYHEEEGKNHMHLYQVTLLSPI